MLPQILIAVLVILLIMLVFADNKMREKSEGYAKYIIPQTLADRYKYAGSCYNDRVTMFYQPQVACITNRCGDYGFR